jgi:hypothetical protein
LEKPSDSGRIASATPEVQHVLVRSKDVYLADGTFHQVLLLDPSMMGGMQSLWLTTPIAFTASCSAMSGITNFRRCFKRWGTT